MREEGRFTSALPAGGCRLRSRQECVCTTGISFTKGSCRPVPGCCGKGKTVPESQPAVAAAAEFCRAFDRACRESRMYPAGHRTLVAGFDQLIASATDVLELESPLCFTISDTAISLRGEVVYAGGPLEGNLAFVLFRDGIRELILYRGVEPEELTMLVDIVARVDAIDRWEHDLVTTMWEADFANVDYAVVDALGGQVDVSPDLVDRLRELVLRQLTQAERAGGEAGAGTQAGTVGPAGGARPADDGFVRRILEFLERDADDIPADASDPCPLEDLPLFLANLLLVAESAAAAHSLVRAFTAEIGRSMAAGDRQATRDLVGQLHRAVVENQVVGAVIRQENACAPELRQALRTVMVERVTAAADDESLLQDACLRPLVLPSLLELLREEEDRAVRRALLAALTAHRDLPAQLILDHLSDSRWYVVRNMVQLLAHSPDAYPIARLEPVAGHPDTRVRKELVRVLERMTAAGQETAPLLRRLLRDEDWGVRALAARVVGPEIGESGLDTLLGHVAQPDFPSRRAGEVEAILAAVARLADAGVGEARGIAALAGLWRPRLWRKRPEAVRVQALKALAAVSGPRAEECLQAAAASREAAIRHPARELLRRRSQGKVGG